MTKDNAHKLTNQKPGKSITAAENKKLLFALKNNPAPGDTILSLAASLRKNAKSAHLSKFGNRFILGEEDGVDPSTDYGIVSDLSCQTCTLFLSIDALRVDRNPRKIQARVEAGTNGPTIIID